MWRTGVESRNARKNLDQEEERNRSGNECPGGSRGEYDGVIFDIHSKARGLKELLTCIDVIVCQGIIHYVFHGSTHPRVMGPTRRTGCKKHAIYY